MSCSGLLVVPDPAETITEITLGHRVADFHDLRTFIGSTRVTGVALPNDDVLFVDPAAAEAQAGFYLGTMGPFYGTGVVLGPVMVDGNLTSASMTVSAILDNISWVPISLPPECQ